MRRYIYISLLCCFFAVSDPVCDHLRQTPGCRYGYDAGAVSRSRGSFAAFFVFTYRKRHKPPKDRWYIVFRLCINNMCHVRHTVSDKSYPTYHTYNASCSVSVFPVSPCSHRRRCRWVRCRLPMGHAIARRRSFEMRCYAAAE